MHRDRMGLFRLSALLMALCLWLPAPAATNCTAGSPNSTSVPETTPTSDFTINGDGTVTHAKTGLVWKRCEEGLTGGTCAGSRASVTWSGALAAAVAANAASFAGYSDWRLPNRKELESIVEYCGTVPSINTTVFPNTFNENHWTSTSYLPDPTNAFVIGFGAGGAFFSGKTNTFPARLVRGGPAADAFDALVPTARVLYDGNGSTGGAVPTDATLYAAGATVGVQGNTGSLVKTGATFAGWSPAPAGNGLLYTGGSSFPIAGDTTLYAQWTPKVCTLDVDGNGSIDALTDGLVILRAMFGLTGSSVTNGAIGSGPARGDWASIRAYLNGNCGTAFGP